MFTKVLVATDLSPASDALVSCLGSLKGVGTEEVTLAHVIQVSLHYPDMGDTEEALARVAAPKLELQRQRVAAAGFTVRTAMPIGIPHVEIDRLAAERGADLIAVGSHGEGLMREVVLGSVASELIQHAHRPVLVVRMQIVEGNGGRRCEVACQNPFVRLLYPTDFSDTAEQAFTYVERIVAAGCRSVDLLHVQDRTRLGTHLADRLNEFNAIDRARLGRLEDRLCDLGATQVSVNIPYGSPISLILEQARTGGYSLIVMGSRGRGFIEEVFLGSVSHAIVRQAPIPVLLIPAKR